MTKEKKIVLELAKGKYADADRLQQLFSGSFCCHYVLGQLVYNRLGGMAYDVLARNQLLSAVPSEMRKVLGEIYEAYVAKGRSFGHAVTELYETLHGLDGEYVMLKGVGMIGLYPEGYRTSNDIDLLVNPSGVAAFSERLTQAGFRRGYLKNGEFYPATREQIVASRMLRGETVPFIQEVGLPFMKYLEVDVNFSLGYTIETGESICDILRSGVDVFRGQVRARLPQKSDFLIHLCAHLFKEATTYPWVEMGKDTLLYKFCDIDTVLQEYTDADYQELCFRAGFLGVERECYFALCRVKDIFGGLPGGGEAFLSSIRPKEIGYMNEIQAPAQNKVYYNHIPYASWIFYSGSKKIRLLTEKEEA